MDPERQEKLKVFHQENAKALRLMAARLREAGVLRVHYGMDYTNDEADLADYAVIEYTDGHTEELNTWYALLDYEVLSETLNLAFGAYTFDVPTAHVLEDEQGGVVRLVSRMSRLRAYHSPKRRAKFEAENARKALRKQARNTS
jgi:hypothetical protein